MATPLTLLLPAFEHLRGGLAAAPEFARWLGRADALPRATAGKEAQLLRHFDVLPKSLPVAALTRALDVDDAGYGAWLRCDPAHVRPDLTTARLLAIGEGLELTTDEAQALLAPLKPLFGDAGMPITAPVATRWYLTLPDDMRLPKFTAADEVLGADLSQHLPEGPDGRRWRHLLNEAQVLLHQHPLNATRVAAGKPAVNSLWFWGGGRLPDSVRTTCSKVASVDLLLRALCRQARVECSAPPSLEAALDSYDLIDLRRVRDVAELERELLPMLLPRLKPRPSVLLDFADGVRFELRHAHRRRWLRRQLRDWPVGA